MNKKIIITVVMVVMLVVAISLGIMIGRKTKTPDIKNYSHISHTLKTVDENNQESFYHQTIYTFDDKDVLIDVRTVTFLLDEEEYKGYKAKWQDRESLFDDNAHIVQTIESIEYDKTRTKSVVLEEVKNQSDGKNKIYDVF